MSKVSITINAKTLFPISKLKKHLNEAFAVSDTLGPVIITHNNRPAYAIVRISDTDDICQTLAEQIELARKSSKGQISIDPNRWEDL